MCEDMRCADDTFYRPVPPLNQLVGGDAFNQCQWGVVVKWDDGIDGSQCGKYGHAVSQRIDGTVGSLTLAFD